MLCSLTKVRLSKGNAMYPGDHPGSSAGPDPRRWRALALLAVADFVVGLILGGVFTSTLGWQWVLFVNVPVTLGAAALAPFLIRESRADTTDHSADYPRHA